MSTKSGPSTPTPAPSAIVATDSAPPAGLVTGVDGSLRAVAELASDYFRSDKDGRVAFVGSAIVKALGYDSADELVGRHFSEFWVRPEQRADLIATLQRDGGFDERRIEIFHKNGSVVHGLLAGRVVRDASGVIAGYVGRVLDQTAGMETRAALVESRAHLAAILDSTRDLSWSMSVDGFRLLTFNREFAEYFLNERGFRVERGMTIAELFPAGPYVEIWEEFLARAVVEQHFTADYVVYSGRRTLQLSFHLLRRDGAPFAISVFGHDVTRQKRAEDELRLSEERFSKVFYANPTPMVITELGEVVRIVDANDAVVQLLGYSREEIVGRSAVEVGAQPDPARADANRLAVLTEGRIRMSAQTFRAKSGRPIRTMMSSEPVVIDGRHCQLVLLQDVTEQARLEEQFLQAQKMEVVGRLAGGVAHDFNNLLTVIVGRSDWLVTDLPDGGELQMQAREILQAGARATELTEQLLAISRKQAIHPIPLRLSSVIADHERMFRRILGEDVRLETRTGDGLAAIMADSGQIHQVLMNLAVNSRDAMPAGGRVTIEARNVEIEAKSNDRHGVPPGSYVMLSVSDSGIGMDAAVRARALEPFFTTKASEKGTGLGLATVERIVTQAGGAITIDSEPGRGTTIAMYFPAVNASVRPPTEPELKEIRGTESVLLVEDQDDLRLFAKSALERFGYHVIEAPSGVRALDFARGKQRIDLMVSDIVLPDLRGTEIANRIRRERPGLRVLFMSGYTETEPGAEWTLGPRDAYLRKPFTMAALAGMVRELVDRA